MGKSFCRVEWKWCKHCHHGIDCKFNNPLTPVLLTDIHKCPKREMNETISFRKLLSETSFDDIMAEMFKYWPEEERNRSGYENLYSKLLDIKGKKSDYFIICSLENDNSYDDNGNKSPEPYVIASCIRLENPSHYYAMDFEDWAEVVTMNITQDTLDTLTPAQIACGVFYEITFNGFNQDSIDAKRNELCEVIEEMKKKFI